MSSQVLFCPNVKFFTNKHSLKAFASIMIFDEFNDTFDSDVHSLKADSSIFSTDEGIAIYFNEVHLLYDESLIVIRDAGNSKCNNFNDVHFLNA